jgi:hypothetical protein
MFDIRELDPELVEFITSLRKEASKFRHQRNGARAEADKLRAELAARGDCQECHCQDRSDADSIDKGLCPRSGAPVGGRGQCHPSHWDSCRQCPLRTA